MLAHSWYMCCILSFGYGSVFAEVKYMFPVLRCRFVSNTHRAVLVCAAVQGLHVGGEALALLGDGDATSVERYMSSTCTLFMFLLSLPSGV